MSNQNNITLGLIWRYLRLSQDVELFVVSVVIENSLTVPAVLISMFPHGANVK